jgi:chromosome segregation ATPase
MKMVDIKKDISEALVDFYEKLVEPEFRTIRSKLDVHDQKLKDLLDHFDRIYARLDRLETEYFSINAAIDRLEGIVGKIDKKLDAELSLRERLEKEILDLKQRVSVIQDRIEDLEKRLKSFS